MFNEIIALCPLSLSKEFRDGTRLFVLAFSEDDDRNIPDVEPHYVTLLNYVITDDDAINFRCSFNCGLAL